MKTLQALFVSVLFISLTANSQQCGFDQYRDLLRTQPNFTEQEEAMDQLLYQYILAQPEGGSDRTTHTVPVVFHIIHNNGPENVSDALIQQALDELNGRMENSAPYFETNGVNMDIEFCLASIDPFGNATTGITRDQSSLTMLTGVYGQDIEMKNINRWCPDLYLNIWIVADIAGPVAGYASFAQPGNQLYDGIVVEYGYIVNSYVLVHEVGHYFNLWHTFEGGCTNFNCLLNGDQICDTPPDQLQNSCGQISCSTALSDTTGLSPFTTASVAEVPNYMDYSYCPTSFTAGQKDRALATLTLLRPSLLQSNGCGSNPGGSIPNASFTVDSSYCTGTMHFNSTSTDALYVAWDFENDGFFDAAGSNVSHTFTTSGYYTIKVLVSGYGGSDTVSQQIYVNVPPTPNYPITGYSGVQLDPFLNELYACYGEEVTFNAVPGMASYLWSTGATTQTMTFTADTTITISLEATDINGYTWVGCYTVEINVANPILGISANIGDTVDCGQYVLLALSPMPYYNVPNNQWYYNGAPLVTNQFLYATGAWTTGNNEYYVINTDINGCIVHSDTFNYYVPDHQTPTISQHGNTLTLSNDCLNVNWFQDGQVLFTSTDSFLVVTDTACYYAWCDNCGQSYTDTICVTSFDVGLTELQESAYKVYPNPFNEQMTLELNKTATTLTLLIYDISGKKIIEKSYSSVSHVQLDTKALEKGAYLLKLIIDGQPLPPKLVISGQ